MLYLYVISDSFLAAAGNRFFLYYAFQHVHNPQFASKEFRNASIRGTFGDSLVRQVLDSRQLH